MKLFLPRKLTSAKISGNERFSTGNQIFVSLKFNETLSFLAADQVNKDSGNEIAPYLDHLMVQHCVCPVEVTAAPSSFPGSETSNFLVPMHPSQNVW